MIAERDDIEALKPRGRTRRALIWRRTQWALLGLLGVILLAIAAVWIARKPIANNVVASELRKRGVQATYKLEQIGLRTQRVSNLVIGDPANPDLTARVAQVQMRLKWDGSVEFYRIAARGVRLKGRVVGNKVSWGQIDKLLPPPSGKPFTLPNVVVDVADTTIALRTPFGALGFALRGRGNLAGGFKGTLAASAPLLAPGACRLERLRAHVAIAVEARRPHVVGPVGANAFACPSSRLALSQPRMDIDSTFSEAFGSFDGKGRLTMNSLIAGVNGLAAVNSRLTFKGTPTDIAGAITLGARQARLASILADRTNIDGRYRLDARRGALTLVADYGAHSVKLAPSLTAGITGPLASAKGTPLEPIGAALVRAISGAAGNFNVEGALRMVNRRGGGGVRLDSARARSVSGAAIDISGGDGVTYYWPQARLRIDGDIATSGGGLPSAQIRLRQPRNGGAMSGTADIAPYAAGGARIALAPVTFLAARRDGWTQVSTVALLDGPFGGGRVTGLRVPIDGRFGAGGGLVFGQGCIEARFAMLQLGGLRLGATRLPLCPTGPAILYRQAGSPLQFGVATRNVMLNGMLGKAPFALNAASARMLGQREFAAAGLRLRLGQADAPVLINAASVKGSFSGRGISGLFAGADGKIGNVPLNLSDASGKWHFYNSNLTIDGGLTVADAVAPAKFYPLRSDNMHFALANGLIRATGTLKHPASGTRIAEVTIDHRLDNGIGRALLDVTGIHFGEGLQPEELTRLTEGVIALVTGDLSGQGRIAWAGRSVKSTGEFTVRDTNLAARFGPVTGLNTTVHFTDLLGLVTAPDQVATVRTINPGILVSDGVIHYSLLPGRLVRVERGEWPFMGGRLILQETTLDFNRPTTKKLTFEVVGLDAKTFVDTMGFKEIGATGVFDGFLPMVFDESGGRIVGGKLDSRPGGGTLSYNGVVNKANTGMVSRLAFDALRDLKFKSMIIRLDGYLDGEFATRLTVEGVGLGNTSTQNIIRSIARIPFKFNVSIKGPFRALIATAKSFRDPSDVISGALPRPLKDVPGIVTEVRRIEEDKTQTQTPVDEKVTVSTKSPPK